MYYGACSFTVVLVSPVFFLFWQSRWASFRTVVELMANFPVRRGTRMKQRKQQQEHNSLVASESILVEGKLDSELDADLTLAWKNSYAECRSLNNKSNQIIEASGEDYVCPFCCLIQNNSIDPSLIVGIPCLLNPSTDFKWGEISGHIFCDFIRSAYEVVHWRSIIFLVPFGKAGRSFVSELTRLYQAFVDDSALCSIAMMACSVMQPLLLVSGAGPRIILAISLEGLIYGRRGYLMN